MQTGVRATPEQRLPRHRTHLKAILSPGASAGGAPGDRIALRWVLYASGGADRLPLGTLRGQVALEVVLGSAR